MTPIPHEIYRFRLEFLEPGYLPAFKGSTLRGAFGHSLRRVVCALRSQDCPTCLVRESCTYQRVFETRVDPSQGPRRGVDVAPHPYVLVPPAEERREYGPGDGLECRLLLLGPALGALPYLVYAFQELGRSGLGARRTPLALRRVEGFGAEGWGAVYDDGRLRVPRVEAPPPEAPALDERVPVRLVTPLRVKERGGFLRALDFRSLMLAVLRRAAHLGRYYGDGSEPPIRELLDRAQAVETARSELRWHDWERYSNRQQTAMQLGGLVGEVEFRGDLRPFAPWLAWAERFHVGKATSFGLGRVECTGGWGGDG